MPDEVPPPVEPTPAPEAPRRAFLLMHYPPKESILPEDLLTLIGECEDLGPGIETLDVILNSTGGDIYTAYKMVHVIRGLVKNVTVIVPIRAKSAATLMALGADRIVMATHSELGPLDLPMEHPESGTEISALDAVRSVEYFAGVLENFSNILGREIYRYAGLPRHRAVELALGAMTEYLAPIVEKLDPAIVHKSLRELEIAERYGREFLTDYMLKKKRGVPERDARRIARTLVWEYPSHGFAISRGEAKQLGLLVEHAEKYDKWNEVWRFFLRFRRMDEKVIWLIPEKKLSGLAGIEQESDENKEGGAK